MPLSSDWVYLQTSVFLVGIFVDDKHSDISLPCLLSVGMQTSYLMLQHLNMAAWRRTGNSLEVSLGGAIRADGYVKVTLCQRGIPRLRAVTSWYSHSEYVGMGVRMGGRVGVTVRSFHEVKDGWAEKKHSNRRILQIMENFCSC